MVIYISIRSLFKQGNYSSNFPTIRKLSFCYATLHNFTMLSVMYGANIFKYFALIPSRPVALEDLSEERNLNTNACEIGGML